MIRKLKRFLFGGVMCMMLATAMPVTAFADVDWDKIEDFDTKMHDQIIEQIDNTVDEDTRDKEKERIDELYEKLKGNQNINSQTTGQNLLAEMSKQWDKVDLKPWINQFNEKCETYEVPAKYDTNTLKDIGATLDRANFGIATSQLKHLQFNDGDTEYPLKTIINKILTDSTYPLHTLMSAMMGLSAAFCIAFGLGSMIEKINEKNASTETLWREFMKICLGIFLIYNCAYVATAIISTGGLLLNTVLSEPAFDEQATKYAYVYKTHLCIWDSYAGLLENGTTIATMKSGVASGAAATMTTTGILSTAFKAVCSIVNKGTGVGAAAAGLLVGGPAALAGGILGPILIPLAGSAIINVATSFTVYAVAIEIGVRFVMTPLAIADLYSEKLRSTGVRWLKALAALAVQGTVIYVIIVVGTIARDAITAGATFGTGIDPVGGFVINLTMIGFFAKSRGIANDIIGTH